MTVWRNSASLILAARHGHKSNRTTSSVVYNYKLLCLKRHHKSSFFPESYVFPGGVSDPFDSNLKWRELFAAYGFDTNSFASLVPKTTQRPQIFKSQHGELPREISLRITAIRETFEECGVLMCKRKNDSRELSNWAQYMSIPQNELQIWQDRIHNDGTEFYTLCEKFECYPDLWALHEWSNWMTPTIEKKRYDTVFFLACMPFMPRAEYEASEMEDLKWETPEDFLSLTMDIILPPPQQYEIGRIAQFEDIDRLAEFAVEQGKMGVQMSLPVCVHLKDGVVLVLPGDSMYPEEPNLFDKQIIDKSDVTVSELEEISPKANRMHFINSRIKVIKKNIKNNTIFKLKNMFMKPQIKNKL